MEKINRKWINLMVMLVVFCLPIGLLVFFYLYKQPLRYEGKEISHWFSETKTLVESPELDVFRRLGPKTVPFLQMKLQKGVVNERFKAAWILGQLEGNAEDAVPYLIDTTSDPNANVRYYSIAALNNIGTTDAKIISPLIMRLNDTNKAVSANAFYLLSKIEEKTKDSYFKSAITNDFDYAITLLNASSPQVRVMGVYKLGNLKTDREKVLSILENLMDDPEESVKQQAAMFLRISTPSEL